MIAGDTILIALPVQNAPRWCSRQIKWLRVPPAGGFIAIHGGVRAAKEHFIALAIGGIGGQTDGRSDANLIAVERIRLTNSLANLRRDSDGALRVIKVRQQHHEFVATVTTGDVVTPDASCDAGSHT